MIRVSPEVGYVLTGINTAEYLRVLRRGGGGGGGGGGGREGRRGRERRKKKRGAEKRLHNTPEYMSVYTKL